MEEQLTSKLHAYIATHNPDLLLSLQQEKKLSAYLEQQLAAAGGLIGQLRAAGQPAQVIEEQALQEMTRHLRPSRYHYLTGLLADRFPDVHRDMVERGTLTFEVTQMISLLATVFEEHGFAEGSEQDPVLREDVTDILKASLATHPRSIPQPAAAINIAAQS